MQVFVTPKGERDFNDIMDYLHTKWGTSFAKKFLEKTNNTFKILQKYPQLGEPEYNDIRGFQLTEQIRLLYRLRDTKIVIIAFLTPAKTQQKSPFNQKLNLESQAPSSSPPHPNPPPHTAQPVSRGE